MADTTEPLVPLLASPPTQAMSLSAALRQASIDVPPLPPGVHLSASITQESAQAVVTVRARNAYGVAVWEQRYDGSGKRLTVGAGITF